MPDMTPRMLTLPNGKRATMKFDDSTWTAINWLASQQGMPWHQWCREVLQSVPEDQNMTAAIRQATVDGLLRESVFKDRNSQLATLERHALLRDSGLLDDVGLEALLDKAKVEGQADFGGFEVLFGQDEHGQDCVWIKNGLRGHLHLAFIVPQIGGGAA